jgi:hypothetical protein
VATSVIDGKGKGGVARHVSNGALETLSVPNAPLGTCPSESVRRDAGGRQFCLTFALVRGREWLRVLEHS